VSRIVGPHGRRGSLLPTRRRCGRRHLLRRQGGGRRDGQRGATLVEFSLIVIPLAILIFGAIEFGWAYNQQQDVRFGAREGARMAAVSNINGTNTNPSAQDIADALCSRMDSASSSTTVTLKMNSIGPPWAGVSATITVEEPLQQVTHFFGWILDGKTITSTVTFVLEQQPTWANDTNAIGPLSCP
jgi:Flp pilus assembly protein TadG